VVATSDLVLAPGMVFTVEPLATREHGIYQAETGRSAVTAEGHEVLTGAPTEPHRDLRPDAGDVGPRARSAQWGARFCWPRRVEAGF